MTPFKIVYERKWLQLVHWDDIKDVKLLGPEMITQIEHKVNLRLK